MVNVPHIEPPDDVTDRLPARARPVTYGLVAVFLVAGLAQVEFWPVTAFRLFSTNRGPEQTRWELAVVDANGSESRVDLARLPPALKGVDETLPRLAGAPPAAAAATVRPWLIASGHAYADVTKVRVYSVTVRLDHGRGPAVAVSRRLMAEVAP